MSKRLALTCATIGVVGLVTTAVLIPGPGIADPGDTGDTAVPLPVDTGIDPGPDTSGRIYNPDGSYTLLSATGYTPGDTVVIGPITWEYVGPMVFRDEFFGPDEIRTDPAPPPAPPEQSTHQFLQTLVRWDAQGHKFIAKDVDVAAVDAAIDAYNSSHPSDADPVAPPGAWQLETSMPSGTSWADLSYKHWSHGFSQHLSGTTMRTARWSGGSWWNRIDTVGEVVPDETDAVVTMNFCSGVLIEEDVVLTARHCVFDNWSGQVGAEPSTLEWCTRGNLDGMDAACALGSAVATHPDAEGIWAHKKDWALVRLDHAPETVLGVASTTTMVLSQWDDQEDASFEPEILAAAILAGPLNDCDADGTDGFYDDHCDNLRFAREHNTMSKGRTLLHRDDGEMRVHKQHKLSVEYDAMFGSGDSGGPVYWDGLIPGGNRFVVSVVSAAFWTVTGAVNLRGPRVAAWRDEIIATCEAI